MEDFNVKVTNWIENKEAQELFFNLGASWCYGKHINENIPSDCDIILHNFGSQLFWAHTGETENYSESKEITLQELRDMVEPKVKEYLTKNSSGNYQLVNHRFSEDDIAVPEGAEILTTILGDEVFYKSGKPWKWYSQESKRWMECSDVVGLDGFQGVLWQREKESLNDKIATAEVARQQSKNIDATLAERQSQYGSFEDVAFVTENIMATLAKARSNGLQDLPHTHRMALYMIASKMARIVNGDFNHLDSWHDIGGYSKLIEDLIAVDQ